MTRLHCRRRRGSTLVELLVIVLILVLLLAFFVPACERVHHEGSGRVSCSSNLRQIGQALLLYSNDNHGALPRARATSGPSVTPVWGTGAAAKDPFADDGPSPNDVTAALFLLLRTQDMTSDV